MRTVCVRGIIEGKDRCLAEIRLHHDCFSNAELLKGIQALASQKGIEVTSVMKCGGLEFELMM